MLAIVDGASEPTLLVGDLNAPPSTQEFDPLWEVFDDTWDRQGEEPGHTFPATDPTSRIDYVLTSPTIETDSGEVLDAVASDHRPVVADLSLPGSAAGRRSQAEASSRGP